MTEQDHDCEYKKGKIIDVCKMNNSYYCRMCNGQLIPSQLHKSVFRGDRR